MNNVTEKNEVHRFNLRFPTEVYRRLVAYRRERPYLSINSLIIEAIIRFLDKQEKKAM